MQGDERSNLNPCQILLEANWQVIGSYYHCNCPTDSLWILALGDRRPGKVIENYRIQRSKIFMHGIVMPLYSHGIIGTLPKNIH